MLYIGLLKQMNPTMKKHSPNFHQNLHEAETAQYHWGRTAMILFSLLAILIISLTSCTKEVSKPMQLRAPSNRPVPVGVVEVTMTGKPRANANSKTGYFWTVDVILSKQATRGIQIVFSWDDSGGKKGLTLSSPIHAGSIGVSDQRNYAASSANARAENFKLIAVYGDSLNNYILKN